MTKKRRGPLPLLLVQILLLPGIVAPLYFLVARFDDVLKAWNAAGDAFVDAYDKFEGAFLKTDPKKSGT